MIQVLQPPIGFSDHAAGEGTQRLILSRGVRQQRLLRTELLEPKYDITALGRTGIDDALHAGLHEKVVW